MSSSGCYDVFISFRGKDTRNNFVSHLSAALLREGVRASVDDGIKRAEEVAPLLHQCIEQSRISIIVFSKNYASSPWCLAELVKILECRQKVGQIVLPVFYNVDPSELEDLTGRFGEAFCEHEVRFKDKVSSWRAALREASFIRGWVLMETRPESLLVRDIVNCVLEKLHLFSCETDGLVGMESRVKRVEQLLVLGSFDTRVLGIWGMGGIGKTTIARAVFNRIYDAFDNCCFLDNIMESVKKFGLLKLQRELSAAILGVENISTDALSRLRRKRVLIVLDDVGDIEEKRALIKSDQLGPASRIIITSRDKHLLKSCGVDGIYEVQSLSNRESLQLFSFYAFQQNFPAEDYRELSNRIIQYAMGLPLALKICGLHFFDSSLEEWKNVLDRWRCLPYSEVQDVLKVSFSGLDDQDKAIFLDIACFFRGQVIDHVKDILSGCGFNTDASIATLIDKALISISDRRLDMHNLVQEMGWEIVCQESISEPGRRSRLWNHKDVYHVLTANKGTEEMRAINLDVSKMHQLYLSSNAFTSVQNLKFLKFSIPISKYCEDDSKLFVLKGLDYLPASLRLLQWDRYPLKSLPENFEPGKLVELTLRYSNLEQLWKRTECLTNLKRINLSRSKHLVKMPDLSLAPNLESIILEGCSSLSEVHPSIQHLSKLAVINLKDCIRLKSFSITRNLPSLELLNLAGCSRLKVLGLTSPNVKSLLLDETAITELPQTIKFISNLAFLSLKKCKRLNTLPIEICQLKSLKTISLSGCSKLENFPEILEPMKNLEVLRLDGTSVREMPKTREMDKLKILSFNDCNLFEMPNWICRFSSLEQLNLGGNNFVSLPVDIKQLFQLKLLDISSCHYLHSLPELPSRIEYLNAHDCASLESVSIAADVLTVSEWSRPMFLFTNCFKLDLSAFLNSNFVDDQGSALLPPAGICFPGSKIPEQISYQSVGSSLGVPAHWIKIRIRGLALAAVLGFKDCLDNHGFVVKCTLKLRTKHEDSISMQRDFIICHGQSGHWNNSRMVGSDHVFLSYNHNITLLAQGDVWRDKSSHTTASLDFYAVDSVGRPLPGCEVRECGFSLKLAEDDNVYDSSCYYY